MFSTYQKLWQLLNPHERRQALLLLGLVVVMGFMQMAGVASVMPFMSTAANPEVVQTNAYLAAAYRTLGFTTPERFLLFLGVVVFLTVIISIAVKALTTYVQVRFSEMRKYSLSRKLMAGYLHQPYDWFLNRHSADLGKNILTEAEQVIDRALGPALALISEGVVVLAVLVLLIIVDPLLAIGLAAGVGGAYAIVYLLLRRPLARVGAERL
jgi:ABC-type multidrug transport system fused ATPase/permease subunit